MKKLYVEIDDSKRVVNWANVNFSENNIELELPDDHAFFDKDVPFRLDESNNLLEDSRYMVELYKKQKNSELNESCEETITGKFLSTVRGESYYFSNDVEAQMNFGKAERGFDKGRMTEVFWTAYKLDNQAIRIAMNQDEFEIVYLEHLNHIDSNIAKYRDFLLPILLDSTSIEEINLIEW